jgi:hypothetical protein
MVMIAPPVTTCQPRTWFPPISPPRVTVTAAQDEDGQGQVEADVGQVHRSVGARQAEVAIQAHQRRQRHLGRDDQQRDDEAERVSRPGNVMKANA